MTRKNDQVSLAVANDVQQLLTIEERFVFVFLSNNIAVAIAVTMCFNSISVLNKLVTVSARLTHSLIVLVQLSCHLANYTVSQKELRLFFLQ